ncbi:MAG TPA: ABC transporter permease, partial [Calditrichaeota bacterium]|nr:ABC transporter permease [Calditrichota bacterium]
MLLSLAWRNVWRNRKRSLIILFSIAFGLWGGLFSDAMMLGMMDSVVETAIKRDIAHIQIHKEGYSKDKNLSNYIPDGETVLTECRQTSGVSAVSGRVLIEGIAASPASSFGVRIVGIDPAAARQVTDIHANVIEGNYFEMNKRNPIVIGKKLAERLNLKIHSKVVLSFQDLHGNIAYMACRVNGIFKTSSSQFDAMNVYLRHQDILRILDSPPIYHEIAIRIGSVQEVALVATQLKERFSGLEVKDWQEIAPELAYLADMTMMYSYVFVGIILLALLFGITNTMLMSVVDRIREFGVLIAIGMNKVKVFSMIVMETILLSLTGGFIGILLGVVTISFFARTGIDLGAISYSLESFGASTMLYPFLP